MTSYANAAALMKQQRIPPIVGWEVAAKMLEQWLVMLTVLLGTQERYPAVFELATLLAAADEVNSRLQAQVAVQQDIPAALFRIIQTEFNESFRQPPSALASLYPPFIQPHHRAHPTEHSQHARRVLTKSTNHRRSTPKRRPAPQDLDNTILRRGSPHHHITSGSTKFRATSTSPSWTSTQTPPVHGTSGGDIRHSSATNRQRPSLIFELPPKRCVQLQLWRPSRTQDALLTRAGRPKCL